MRYILQHRPRGWFAVGPLWVTGGSCQEMGRACTPRRSPEHRFTRYEVKVRGTMYLWGSSGITHDLTFSKPLILHVNNDTFGERITVGTQVASGAKSTLGTLEAGECVSIPVQGISGSLPPVPRNRRCGV